MFNLINPIELISNDSKKQLHKERFRKHPSAYTTPKLYAFKMNNQNFNLIDPIKLILNEDRTQ